MLSGNENMSEKSLLYVVYHVFLTPHLPQAEDFSGDKETALLQCTLDALLEFGTIDDDLSKVAKSATAMMRAMLRVHNNLSETIAVDDGELVRMLGRLQETGDAIPLHIREQNAGVLITKAEDALHVESFELSPTNESVITTKGRLRRSFPGRAVSISLNTAREPGFYNTLAATLAKMSAQPAPHTLPKEKKAGQPQDENRDTAHPKMVTELLDAFLQAVGRPLDGIRIWKNTREEVRWKNARLPWRRSPAWMLIRVSLQLVFSRSSQNLGLRFDAYKIFMAFLMAEVLERCISLDFRSDIIYSIVAKLSRRLIKLGSSVENGASKLISERMCRANKFLLDRWTLIQKQDSPDWTLKLSRLESLDFSKDTTMQLSDVDSFLASIESRKNMPDNHQFNPSWTLIQYDSETLPELTDSSDREHLLLNLAAFESWVENNLQTWMKSQLVLNHTNTCAQLRHLIERYHGACSSLYDGNPESVSIMLLTILELWIACDRAAVHVHPLLRDYEPGIPRDLLQNLLLPFKKQMCRLSNAETYLVNRSAKAISGSLSFGIYTSFGASDCFAVRFFNQSPRHETLFNEIQAKASSDREAKRREFATKQAEYNSLMQQFSNGQCEYEDVFDYKTGLSTYHKEPCERCSYRDKAKNIWIHVHEWPLPKSNLEAKSVVFELALPETFGQWREASMFVLLDVLKLEHGIQNRPPSHYALEKYDALSNFFLRNFVPQRIGLLSGTKPNVVTHRNPVDVGTAVETQICLNNGLHFSYYDDKRSCFVNDLQTTDTIPEMCTYKLSKQSSGLQRFLFRPASSPSGPPPNAVIATQDMCPDGMALDEYKALAQIPLGYRIQWQNVLIQLFSPTIDFKKRDVGLVVLQCIYQAGPDSNVAVRSAHGVLEDDNFASRLLEGIRDATSRFEENWQSSTALATFISLTCRLLSLTQSPAIQQQCLDYLCEARRITFAWAKNLRGKARTIPNDDEKTVIQCRAMEIFLICADTFNTDPGFQQSILSVDEDASVFLQCSIGIQEYSQSLLSTLERTVQFLYSRWQRTSYHCYRFLAVRMVKQHSTALDDAIKASWAAYKPSGHWSVFSDMHNHWLASSTATPLSLSVHFSLVTGELLVSGVPVDHLPSGYLAHPTYQKLFGRLSLEIMLSPVPGMQFSSKAGYAGHEVHLCLIDGGEAEDSDLLVHAVQGERKFDLVPSRHLLGKVPTAFVNDYVHWYNHNENCIDFYDILTPWKYATPNWKLRRLQTSGLWVLSRDEHTLIDVNNPLFGKTGTEEALSILNSASMKSFDILTEENLQILARLAELTPGRSYYPSHQRVMQTVEWDPKLSFLSQHGLFYEYVCRIFDESARSHFFHPQSYLEPPTLDHISLDLLERDNIRSSTFRVSNFGAERHSTAYDSVYEPRDRSTSASSSKAYSISHVIFSGQSTLIQSLPSDIDGHLWRYLERVPAVCGRDNTIPLSVVAYDGGLLLESSSHFIAQNWVALHKTLVTTSGKFDLMVWLATLAFPDSADMAVIQTLASFRTIPGLIQLCAPSAADFKLASGAKVDENKLQNVLGACLQPLTYCPELPLSQEPYESVKAHKKRRRLLYYQKTDQAISSFIEYVSSQWPCKKPEIPSDHRDRKMWSSYLNMEKVLPEVRTCFETWYNNLGFQQYLREIATFLPLVVARPNATSPLLTTPEWTMLGKPRFVSDDDSFRLAAPLAPSLDTRVLSMTIWSNVQKRGHRLLKVLSSLSNRMNNVYEKRYINDLHASLEALQGADTASDHIQVSGTGMRDDLVLYLQECKKRVEWYYDAMIKAILGPEAGLECFSSELPDIYSRPRLSPTLILQRLNKDHLRSTPDEWKRYITEYATAITQLQRAERMLAHWDDPAMLFNELRNPGHSNCQPLDHPDTLLLEVESGIMVREVQENVAKQMREPPSAKNAVMQLNMGEGKSSVIVPIVAAALADRSRLIRIVVAKPQSKQMLQMLESKLGGMLNRRIFHLPFSRALKMGSGEVEALGSLCRDCMESAGVLLVQPEHILSFQLMGIESAISGSMDVSRSLLRTKDFLDQSSRDIVDESDENFSVKFELVYTIGTQRPVEHSPFRWQCIHQVLKVIRQIIGGVEDEYPNSIEISYVHKGCFPRLRILRDDAKDRVLSLVAHQLSTEGITGLPMAKQPERIQNAAFKYISKANLTLEEVESVESSSLWSESTKNTLFLLRGLIALQVLSFVFCQKRWKVDFGLTSNRNPSTRLAVPYRAKDSPSARSEFSHPEVIIALTSLSYYYGGLTDSDMFLSFDHLVRSDQADMEYRFWIEDSDRLPHAFHQLSGVNLEDRPQCTERVFPCLRYSKAVVDYFLEHIVFPKELKEFPYKLSASGWDIGEEKRHPTTGFSGTNDSRAFLPLTVSQVEDRKQKHTNALVMENLLQDENSALLEVVTRLKPPVRVILDVGAQVIELDNLGFANRWLEMLKDDQNTQAVIFCDEDDQICVVDRRGRVETFQTSPFAGQTDVCLVFLDEAHTRGTDLKLPGNYRAAVTLGANLTRDRLVQDVLKWAISETFVDLRRGIRLWANQGRRHKRHKMLWMKAHKDGSTQLDRQHATEFLEDEAQTLETRYRPTQRPTFESSLSTSTPGFDTIAERLHEFGGSDPGSATFREEQERELSPEVQEEKEIQKPPAADPAGHSVHPDLRRLVSQGTFTIGSEAYMPAFMSLAETSAAQHYNVGKFPSGLLVTTDFARTIIPFRNSHISDLFQRSVQWILTTASETGVIEVAIILSPYEAHELLPEITQGRHASLHLYAPRPNMGFRALDSLDLYSIPHHQAARTLPRNLATELNLFSGQLYVQSPEEYVDVRNFLGLAQETIDNDFGSSDIVPLQDVNVEEDGLVQFMKVLMTKIRRNCESIDKTHVGRILDHGSLKAEDFE
ncbi:hypothetical protein LX36DRAFT_704109 [Colletotrichum falcatum]|nr:hypothetical protein LX36DRAFT_704109 [Colletotrichum falcatum]